VKPIKIDPPYIGGLSGCPGETPPYIGIVLGYIGTCPGYISRAGKYIAGLSRSLGTLEINRGKVRGTFGSGIHI
jgi:hypothetical protein